MDNRWMTFFMLLFQLNWDPGYLLSMLSQGQVLVVNAGQFVSLDCEFYTEYFNLFDNPVLWKKTQRNETTRMNIMGNMLAPFVVTDRFDVTFHRESPKYKFTLEIMKVSLEDSGNYTCEVRGPKSSLQGLVTHTVFVRVPVNMMYITDTSPDLSFGTTIINATEDAWQEEVPSRLLFREFQPSSVRCVSVGGYPPPDMDIYLGGRQLTDQFSLRHTAILVGDPGLRQMMYRTERWTDSFRAEARDDGDIMKCYVTITGLGTNVTSSPVTVQYAPVVKCDPAGAYLGDKNIYIRCEVKARPGVTVLYWSIGNGTTVTPGQVRQEMWTITMDKGHYLEAKLYMRVIRKENFRKYSITVENTVSATSDSVELTRNYKAPPKGEKGSTTNVLKYNARQNRQHESERGYRILSTGTTTSAPKTLLLLSSLTLWLILVH